MSVKRSGWRLLTRSNDLSSEASNIYGGLVAQSRAVPFYAQHGVPDTPEGRTELIMLHLVLTLRRLGRDGEAGGRLAQALSEAFVTDMDDNMREMGVGDLMVAKRVKKTAAALFDRLRDYGKHLEAADVQGLADAIERHLLMNETAGPPSPGAARIAAYCLAAEQSLASSATDSWTPVPNFPPI
jgi:cytochrome b pre-mRNA-processing protein 3